MISCQHFRSEFVRQSQATIMRKVTMTQFFFVILTLFLALMLFHLPLLTIPVLVAAAWVLGYQLRGEFVYKRLVAFLLVHGRALAGRPRLVNVMADWEATQSATARGSRLRATVAVQAEGGEIVY
ncbi:MAG: hypothetical protein KDE28_16790 [Anaerolineales bacterium]|nr:hypothetical protein [Anaerolineales bacterium]